MTKLWAGDRYFAVCGSHVVYINVKESTESWEWGSLPVYDPPSDFPPISQAISHDKRYNCPEG